jgi:hypothetical protein
MDSIIFVTLFYKGVSTSIDTSRNLLYTSFTSYCSLVVLCMTSSHSSMSLLYSACSASLSAFTLANSIEVKFACNWISCVTLVCKLYNTFMGNCDNTKSIWLNSCMFSCIYVMGNSMAPTDIFMIQFFVDVGGGCDVVGQDSILFIVLSICSYYVLWDGIILVD